MPPSSPPLWLTRSPTLFFPVVSTLTLPRIGKSDGFPQLHRLYQTSLLTSVGTVYYFTELRDFRWGAVIKWSGTETRSCLLVPQVFTSQKYTEKHWNCSVGFMLKCPKARHPASSRDVVQKLILTPDLPVERFVFLWMNSACWVFNMFPQLYEFSICSYF